MSTYLEKSLSFELTSRPTRKLIEEKLEKENISGELKSWRIESQTKTGQYTIRARIKLKD